MMKIVFICFLALTTMSGCQSIAERKQGWIREAKADCKSYGFVQNTADMATCVQMMVENKEQSNREYWQNMSQAFKGMTLQPTDSINCTSTRMGATINTRCN